MPIYEYVCESCCYRFERIIRTPDDALRCPQCGAVARRQVSAAAVATSATGGCAPRGGFS